MYKQKVILQKLITGTGDIQPVYPIQEDIKTNNDRETAALRERQIEEENTIGRAIDVILAQKQQHYQHPNG